MSFRSMFNQDGFLVVKSLIKKDFAEALKIDLEKAIRIEDLEFKAQCPNVMRFDRGMVHNTFIYSDKILSVLGVSKIDETLTDIFCDNSIVYAFQSSSIPGHQTNFGRRIHVDAPRHIENYPTNVGLIIALSGFTKQNGATEFLRGSHNMLNVPSLEYFEKHKEYFECEPGDAMFFNARLWHRTGINLTNLDRHALTINFCRPYMKTRFDFPRLLEKKKINVEQDSIIGRFLGYWTRIPIDLNEFYVEDQNRLYKAGLE